MEFKNKWKVLDEVGNNISYYNRFVQDSDLLKGFIRYRYEPNLIETFTILSKPENEAKLFDFLKRYGNTSDEGFKMIKSNPAAQSLQL